MIIDVTHFMLGDPPTDRRPGGRVARQAIRNWLEDNVGPYYGEDNQVDKSVSIGSGWEFGTYSTPNRANDISISWQVDIADEQLALMFTVRFG